MYREEHDFEHRQAEAEKIRTKYPDRVAVICEKVEGSRVPQVDKTKYLVPKSLTVGQFVYVIRRRVKLDASQALFVMTASGTMLPTSSTIAQIREEHQDEDGFLYLVYSGENAFGSETQGSALSLDSP